MRLAAHHHAKPVQGLHSLARALLFVVKFKRIWTVNGTPSNATSVTITVLDVSTGITVVPAGTPVPNALNETGSAIVGEYEYKLPAALPEHDYKGTIVLSYGTESFTKVVTAHADPPEHRASEPLAHDLSQAIAQNAAGAQSVSSPAGSLAAHSIADQILADQYLATKAAMKSRGGLSRHFGPPR